MKNNPNNKGERGVRANIFSNRKFSVIDEIVHYGSKAQVLLIGIELLSKERASKYKILKDALIYANELLSPVDNPSKRQEILDKFKKSPVKKLLSPYNFVKIGEKIVEDLEKELKEAKEERKTPIESYLSHLRSSIQFEKNKI